ncbi:hypothetical protein [Micromonospora globispora]|nr:hypothetical protein [Micromonospora globispora]
MTVIREAIASAERAPMAGNADEGPFSGCGATGLQGRGALLTH